ncbi:unnamed protein product [Haemonchus placei]|uniref:Uncharacterized protein n=1 Tax=Haemonchus placei TaxID=6290 RepID=A0A0N4WWF3_HAEPC|nr:unnamed protein product [Haemonchus placei]
MRGIDKGRYERKKGSIHERSRQGRKSICKARRCFDNYKIKMISSRRPDGPVTASRSAMKKVIYDLSSTAASTCLPNILWQYFAPSVFTQHPQQDWQNIRLHRVYNIEQAKRVLAELDNVHGRNGLRLNLTRSMFMKNGLVPDAPLALSGTNISKCFTYVYPGRKVNSDETKKQTPQITLTFSTLMPFRL